MERKFGDFLFDMLCRGGLKKLKIMSSPTVTVKTVIVKRQYYVHINVNKLFIIKTS